MAVSGRMKNIMENSSWIRKMFEAGAELKKQYGAENVFDFSLGNPNIDPPEEFSRVLRELVSSRLPNFHSYMPNAGYDFARRAAAEELGGYQSTEIPADSMVMTCGAGGALNAVFRTILNPGDTVLAPLPCFMEYRFYADNHGAALVTVKSRPDFSLDIEAFEKALNPSCAAVLINSPNNPTGKIYTLAELEALAAVLEKKAAEFGRVIYLISDEPYRNIVFDGRTVPPVFKIFKNSIIVTSYSKELSIPGERLGWLAVNPAADGCRELVNGCIIANRILGFVNAPALMQRAVSALKGVKIDSEIYRKKRDLICALLKDAGWKFREPEGTFYVFPEAPGGDDLKAVEALLEERILAVPGRGFGAEGYVRFAFCVDDRTISAAGAGFKRAYQKLVNKQ